MGNIEKINYKAFDKDTSLTAEILHNAAYLDYDHSRGYSGLHKEVADPKPESMRKSGLDIIGNMPWGTHFCQFYASNQDLIEVLVPYIRAGLLANEYCVWVTSAPLNTEEATCALRAAVPDLDKYFAKGQIEIFAYDEWYTRNGKFDAERVLQGWADKTEEALVRGFEGIRVTGNTFWLSDLVWRDFSHYEAKINEVIVGKRILVLCTYSIAQCGVAEILDVLANHEFALIKRAGHWELIESTKDAKTEQALRESEERLRLAIWAAELGVFEWDISSDCIMWENQRVLEIFGRSEADGLFMMSLLLNQCIHEDDRAIFKSALVDAQKPGQLFHVICRIYRCHSHELRWVEISGRYSQTSTGMPFRLLGVIGDITQRKQAEEILRRDKETFERLVNERTDELLKTKSELDNARRLSDIGTLAATVAHELRNPLAAILLAANNIKRKAPDSALEKHLQNIEKKIAESDQIINNLLFYSRIKRSHSEPVQICQILEESLETSFQQSKKRITVLKNLAVIKDLVTLADPLQMKELFTNIINNACDAVAEAAGKIELTATSDGKIIQVAISDNGVGIDQDNLSRVLEPFFTTKTRGTGLGLAVCQQIVILHNGTLKIESEVNKGTTVTVDLPVHN